MGFFIILLSIVALIIIKDIEHQKVKNNQEYVKRKVAESEKLKPRRLFYAISWLGLCLIFTIFCAVFNLENENPRIFSISFSFLMIYGGVGGLFAKMVIWNVPIEPDSKLEYLFNSIFIIAGVYLLARAL